MSKSWLDPTILVQPDKLLKFLSEGAADRTAVLQGQVKLNPQQPPPAPAVDAGQAYRNPAQAQQAPAQATPPAAPAAPLGPQYQPVPRMTELPADGPSLATQTRPDLPSPSQRYQSFTSSYTNPAAMNKSLRRQGNGSLNVVFHGQLANGPGYIAKPHEGIGHRDRFHPDPEKRLRDDTIQALKNEAPLNAQRHDAAYELMSAMGAHHMVAPGMQANMHATHQFKGVEPDEHDSEEKRMTMAKSHAGGLAHVQEFIPDTIPAHQATPDQLNNVDANHRLHGLVGHLLMGNADGHSGNVLIHKSGHPVLIDKDITLGSSVAKGYKEHFGRQTIRSAFAPGGMLDYQAKQPRDAEGKPVPVGTNYPPRMKETLSRAAEGYYGKGEGSLNLSPEDHAVLQQNARDLLSHGLEGTLDRRHDIDAVERAKKAKKQARLAGGST